MESNRAWDALREKFTSGNSIPVERAVITRSEYDAIQSSIAGLEAKLSSFELNERFVAKLCENWERIAKDVGVRAFTGNDHLMFANELRAAITRSARSTP